MSEIKNGLIIVPTPVGNLGDMTYRAVEVLKNCDVVLAEDTRVSARLLKHYGIEKPLWSFHKDNEHRKVDEIVKVILQGKIICLVSDAGTPGISDPGFLLVRACVENGINVECMPGATAFVPALVSSGFPADRFVFEGFIPQKKGRQKRLQELVHEPRTLILYESPHRLLKLLEEIITYFGEGRHLAVCREISKLYEEIVRGTALEVKEHFTSHKPLGEIVVVISGKEKNKNNDKMDEE